MLDGPRDQVARISSRLSQAGGLSSLELAAEVVAYAYVALGAAIESALKESVEEVLRQLQTAAPSSLSSRQLAAVSEARFMAFRDAERQRGRHDLNRALGVRSDLVTALRATVPVGVGGKSILVMTGVPGRDHFEAFLQVATGGVDPRGTGSSPPLGQLIGRVDQIRGPRRDFAHECVDPTSHPLILDSSLDSAELAKAVQRLLDVIPELEELLNVLEQACTNLASVVTTV